MATVIIGTQLCEARQLGLRAYEAAFVLRVSERDVQNRLRRSERAITKGATREKHLERGDLFCIRVGRARRVDIESVAAAVAGDKLGLFVLAALVEGRIQAIRAADPSQLAPSMLLVVDRL